MGNFNIAVLLLVEFLSGCDRLVSPLPTPTPIRTPASDPHSSLDAYFNSDRPSENDTFPDIDAFSDADALSAGYSHAYSQSLWQCQSQLDSHAHSTLTPSPPSSPARQFYAVTHMVITPGREASFCSAASSVDLNTEHQFLAGIRCRTLGWMQWGFSGVRDCLLRRVKAIPDTPQKPFGTRPYCDGIKATFFVWAFPLFQDAFSRWDRLYRVITLTGLSAKH